MLLINNMAAEGINIQDRIKEEYLKLMSNNINEQLLDDYIKIIYYSNIIKVCAKKINKTGGLYFKYAN